MPQKWRRSVIAAEEHGPARAVRGPSSPMNHCDGLWFVVVRRSSAREQEQDVWYMRIFKSYCNVQVIRKLL